MSGNALRDQVFVRSAIIHRHLLNKRAEVFPRDINTIADLDDVRQTIGYDGLLGAPRKERCFFVASSLIFILLIVADRNCR
jgi:hypothetical protein